MEKVLNRQNGSTCCVVGARPTSGSPRVPSSLCVTAVDIDVRSPCSPAVSTLTLAPGRTRDIDQDMQALRLSRQDNPFLQVLASRESLIDSLEEYESDDANLMSQEFPDDLDIDPLSLPEIHEHMIRSPPPITWPKSPNFKVFRFPQQSSEDDSSQESLHHCGKKVPLKLASCRRSRASLDEDRRQLSPETPSLSSSVATPGRFHISPRLHQRSSSDTRDRSPKPFLLLSPESLRLQKRNFDDIVQLVPEGDYDRRLETQVAPPNRPLLSLKRAS